MLSIVMQDRGGPREPGIIPEVSLSLEGRALYSAVQELCRSVFEVSQFEEKDSI